MSIKLGDTLISHPLIVPHRGPGVRIPVERLHVKPNIPAGMDICVVAGLVPRLRKTAEDWPPIKVKEDAGGWEIQDGRHRFFAYVIAGRPDIPAEQEN